MLHGVGHLLTRLVLKTLHPGIVAAGQQLLEDYNFDGIELVLPTDLVRCTLRAGSRRHESI